MNIPPIVRTGPLPAASPDNCDQEYAVMTALGWRLARWDKKTGHLIVSDVRCRCYYIDPRAVYCWMPADGS